MSSPRFSEAIGVLNSDWVSDSILNVDWLYFHMWRMLYAKLIGRIALFTCENIAHIEFYLQGLLPKILAICTIKGCIELQWQKIVAVFQWCYQCYTTCGLMRLNFHYVRVPLVCRPYWITETDQGYNTWIRGANMHRHSKNQLSWIVWIRRNQQEYWNVSSSGW